MICHISFYGISLDVQVSFINYISGSQTFFLVTQSINRILVFGFYDPPTAQIYGDAQNHRSTSLSSLSGRGTDYSQQHLFPSYHNNPNTVPVQREDPCCRAGEQAHPTAVAPVPQGVPGITA